MVFQMGAKVWLLKDGRAFQDPYEFLEVLMREGVCTGNMTISFDNGYLKRLIEKWTIDGQDFLTEYDVVVTECERLGPDGLVISRGHAQTTRRVIGAKDLGKSASKNIEDWLLKE